MGTSSWRAALSARRRVPSGTSSRSSAPHPSATRARERSGRQFQRWESAADLAFPVGQLLRDSGFREPAAMPGCESE